MSTPGRLVRRFVFLPARYAMSAPISAFKATFRWQRLRPYLRSTDWWIQALSAGLCSCLVFGSLLGRLYFFELFSHFQIHYWLVLIGLILASLLRWIIARSLIPTWFLLPSLGLLLLSPNTNGRKWLPGDYDEAVLPPAGEVRVYHANVLVNRSEHKTTLAQLRSHQPDLFVLQEMTPTSIRLVMSQLQTEFPHWFACWSKKTCWTLVGSRTPLRTNPSLARTRQIIVVTTQVRGRSMSLITVHPRVPLLPSWFRQRNAQLTKAAHLTRMNSVPTVLIGDFNISVFSPVYTAIFDSSAKGRYAQRPTLQSGRQRLTQPTWPGFLPSLLMLPIDHAFVNSGFAFRQFRTLGQTGSDHRALVVDLRF